MESRNIKVIDDHGIDRNANVICGLKYEDKDYVLYWIERDNENDNLFVSKLVNNNDGTSNMVNIEDSMEKNGVSEVVKELITYSVNNENDKSNGAVTLKNGKNVEIIPVLFNKEQNINVSKTYVTTVKKTVTKVGSDFYKVEAKEVNNDLFAEPELNDVFEPVAPAPEPVVEAAPVMPEPELVAPTVSETVQSANFELPPLETAPNLPEVPENDAMPVEPAMPQVEAPVLSELNVAPVPVEEAPVEAVVEPTVPVTPVSVEPVNVVPEPEQTPMPESPAEPQLVFDASHETNLNEALGEVSSENVVPVNDVEPLREFGQDTTTELPVKNPLPESELVTPESTPVNSRGGFANKKFFMVIAILLFVGSCVFLGYEAFQYFQIVNK